MTQPTIVVPIHDGFAALRDCIASLRRTLPRDARVELVDDASQDPAVGALLDELERDPPWRLRVVRQRDNLGFVGTVNAAFARCAGDVLLLNSDTVTTAGWLDRMLRCAASDPRIATITPFSNNAEICSFPELCRAAAVPADPERVARAFAANEPMYPELPTAVGFCMYVRGAAVAQVGAFDAATFGRGYGEENDFCMRVAGHGWRNVLCDDAYVVHVGGVSFSAVGLKPGGENLARLVARYPRYNALVADFIARDPLAPIRARTAERLA